MRMGQGAAVVSPNTRQFIEDRIKPLAERLKAGESRETVAKDLLEAVYPWVLQQVRRETAGRLSHGADRAEIMSRMLETAYRRALTFDPDCPQSWPTALQLGLKGAWLEAYRAVDFLTRKHRHMHNVYRLALAEQQDSLGRDLTYAEQMELANEVLPDSSHTDWADIVVNHTPPPPSGLDNVDWDTVRMSLQEAPDDPATQVCTSTMSNGIHAWISQLPEHLNKELVEAMEAGRPISAKSRRELKPFIHHLRTVDRDLWRRAASLAWA